MNIAFIDGQNLHINTSKIGERWEIDLARFREYLKSKYRVSIAYYYIGTKRPKNQDLYETIRKAGYIVKFRQHGYKFTGRKKGNVDSDIIFDIMKLSKQEIANSKIVLVSGDGDYKMVVDYLIEIGKMEKILFPNK